MDLVALAKWVMGIGFVVAALAWFAAKFDAWGVVAAFDAARSGPAFEYGSKLFGMAFGVSGFGAIAPVFGFVGVGASVLVTYWLYSKLK